MMESVNKHGIPILRRTKVRRHRRDLSIDDDYLLHLQKGKCFYCGEREPTTRDHFYPRSAGNMLFGNKVLACLECNQAKGDRQPTSEEVRKF